MTWKCSKRQKLDKELYPVLPEELVEDTPLTEVYVGTITDPRNISKAIIKMNSCFPIPELGHLKRVRGKDILLFPVELSREKVMEELEKRNFPVEILDGNVKRVEVARRAPKVRKQFEVVNKLWPVNFHPNKYLELLTTNSLFDDKEIEKHKDFMRIALRVAHFSTGKDKVGAVAVDPEVGSVVAAGWNCSEGPCRHAVMTLVDNVAKTQGGGVWGFNYGSSEGESLNFDGFREDVLKELKEGFGEMQFGARWFKGKEEGCEGPYLCTGYYVYVTKEPCVMCAMGLVHSRVKRVFYGVRNSKGGLGSLCKVHTVKDLNHHYEVFEGLLEKECLDLLLMP